MITTIAMKSPATTLPLSVSRHRGATLPQVIDRLASASASRSLGRHPAWLKVLGRGLEHDVYCLEAVSGLDSRGWLPLVHVRSLLFGKFLVSLPYLNSGGVVGADAQAAYALVDDAYKLARELRVRYLELRQETPVDHPALTQRREDKVHMRLELPAFVGQLWDGLNAKVRNQVRKGQKSGLISAWGGHELLDEFYTVFSHNMRDLGTPVYGRKLFASILEEFPGDAELCVVRAGETPVAGALLLHGLGVAEVPSAACLRAFNPTCANMLMYWNLLARAVERGQDVFDFGRSTLEGNTYRFKKQWGACAEPAVWQYAPCTGSVGDMRPDHPRYNAAIRLWQRLPVGLTRLLGPSIVRGIP